MTRTSGAETAGGRTRNRTAIPKLLWGEGEVVETEQSYPKDNMVEPVVDSSTESIDKVVWEVVSATKKQQSKKKPKIVAATRQSSRGLPPPQPI